MSMGPAPRAASTVILIGGPSGVGKSRLAHAIAGRTASTVGQLDDLQTAIETLVPADRLPEYHVPATTYLRTDSPDEIVEAIERLGGFFSPGVRGAVVSRLESGTPTVLEGDFVSPEVAAEVRSLGVRPLFLLGTEDEIAANYLEREGDEQRGRARVSALYSRRLAARCGELRLPSISARPFETLLSRAGEALGLPTL
jgi:2-phosphoglycerate kinase